MSLVEQRSQPDEGVTHTRVAHYLESMSRQSRKAVAAYDSDKDGRSLILETQSRNEQCPWVATSAMAAGHISYVWMLLAGTMPLSWMVAYPFIGCYCRLD